MEGKAIEKKTERGLTKDVKEEKGKEREYRKM